ncbi:hypothetical protein [Pseudanabaena minima]|uniref:hypothetical protein n=1 Tax=Pseudanabaena minima TaxID=890415 RepID=UPI003DA7F6B1
MLKPITLQVEAPIADAYQNTTSENRQAFQTLVSIFLQSVAQPTTLQKVVQEIRLEAQQKGLTPEILEEILKDG